MVSVDYTSVTVQDIDELAKWGEFGILTRYISHADELPAPVRNHLAETIRGLLTGNLKRRRGRPHDGISRRYVRRNMVGERVWRTLRRFGFPKVESAVAAVAEELRYSEREVWKCWSTFDVAAAEAEFQRLRESIAKSQPPWCK